MRHSIYQIRPEVAFQMPISYQLRPGVELVIEVRVSLRRNLDNITQEILENPDSDSKLAQCAQEYMYTHARRTLTSLNESRLLAKILAVRETLTQPGYRHFLAKLCCKPARQPETEFLDEFLAEISA